MKKLSYIFAAFIFFLPVVNAHSASDPCVKKVKALAKLDRKATKAFTKAERKVASAEKKVLSAESKVDRAEMKKERALLKYRLREESFKQAELVFDAQCVVMLLFPHQLCAQIPEYAIHDSYDPVTDDYVVWQEQTGSTSVCAEDQSTCFSKAAYFRLQVMTAGAKRKAAESSENRKIATANQRLKARQRALETEQKALELAKAASEKASAEYQAGLLACPY